MFVFKSSGHYEFVSRPIPIFIQKGQIFGPSLNTFQEQKGQSLNLTCKQASTLSGTSHTVHPPTSPWGFAMFRKWEG